jgi:hypothetical protein
MSVECMREKSAHVRESTSSGHFCGAEAFQLFMVNFHMVHSAHLLL